ncbi:Hypothetical protein CINCED_3A011835 [Cinara cedri]|uniref:Uncharacterized protein n=1 Tax=Cinara cedri TaxID=506608 RepID=A0A5E4MYR1_9HEMI|nr:Hypothetical protein CINCED_3A011835 [Cinara cedri]
MDIRRLCLVHIITTIAMLSGCNTQSIEQEDSLTESMHNYTNLKIFLWSGSGDGSTESTETPASEKIPFYSENPEDCIGGQDCNIRPTSVAPHPGVIDIPQTTEIPDKEYWIVTELHFHSLLDVNISIPVMKEKLAVLYTIAFTRQQAQHLGLNAANWTEEEVNLYRNRRWDTHEKPIKVGVHVLSIVNKLDLVYYVTVNEHPVSAATAVRDMSLVTVQEAADYLGYTVKIKARPYLDGLHFQRVRGGVSYSKILIIITAVSIIILALAAGFVIAHKKKKRKNSISSGKTNMACEEQTPHREVKTEATSTEDISTLQTPEPKPRNRNKISNSLLSMQAVNKFQKDSMPEPLTKVLEENTHLNENKNVQKLTRHESIGGQDPGVVGPIVWDLHCKQMQIKSNDPDNDSCSSFDAFNAMDANVTKMRQKFHELLDDAFTLFGSRNSSFHSGDSSPSLSNNEQRSKSAPFRSSATSADGRSSCRPKTSVDSGGGRAEDDELAAATAASSCWALSPGEAWAGSDGSVFVPRPLSAGPFHRPVLRTEFISSDANLSPQDPAVPLIKAIRKELDRFPSSPDPHAADSSSR